MERPGQPPQSASELDTYFCRSTVNRRQTQCHSQSPSLLSPISQPVLPGLSYKMRSRQHPPSSRARVGERAKSASTDEKFFWSSTICSLPAASAVPLACPFIMALTTVSDIVGEEKGKDGRCVSWRVAWCAQEPSVMNSAANRRRSFPKSFSCRTLLNTHFQQNPYL